MTLYHKGMPEQSSKRKKPRDLNRLAAEVVAEATDEKKSEPESTKNPAAVELGRKGESGDTYPGAKVRDRPEGCRS
jgi:hypothetical protein